MFVNSNETGNWRPMAERNRIREAGFVLAKDVGGTNRNGLYRSLGGTGGMPITGFYDEAGNLLHTSLGEMNQTSVNETLIALGLLDPERVLLG